MRTFVPTPDYQAYRVTVMCDRYDKDLGKVDVEVHAIGRRSAEQIALDQVKGRYPSATVVGVQVVQEAAHG